MAAAGGSRADLPRTLTEGFQAAFLTGAGFAVLGFVLGAVLIHGRDSRAHQEQARVSGADQPAEAHA